MIWGLTDVCLGVLIWEFGISVLAVVWIGLCVTVGLVRGLGLDWILVGLHVQPIPYVEVYFIDNSG